MAMGRPPPPSMSIRPLDRALHVFWRKGYEGSSMADLTPGHGHQPAKASMQAYGSKARIVFARRYEPLYRGTSRLYPARLSTSRPAPGARLSNGLLHGAIDLLTGEGNPRGCLLVQGALTCEKKPARMRGRS